MNTFKPGDKVWAKIPNEPEVPCTVIEFRGLQDCGGCDLHNCRCYWLDVPDIVALCGSQLRPRKDDYQQDEGLGDINAIKRLSDLQHVLPSQPETDDTHTRDVPAQVDEIIARSTYREEVFLRKIVLEDSTTQ